ncbi:thioredoxin domain-containing protein 16-like [Glandiceps talaboti]
MAALRVWLVCVFVSGLVSLATAVSLFNKLPARDFKEFKQSPFVRVIYFYKQDIPRLDKFLDDFKESSEILSDYGVKTAIVNCKEDPVKEFCERRHPVENHLLIFKSGYVMTELGLDSMFSIDAIMSNILQMVLLGEVPIVQSAEELETIMIISRGEKDILFSYQKAVGTYEHRIFMEVAFVYGQKYKFAFTTATDVIPVISSFEVRTPSIWYLQCKAVKGKDEACPVLRYAGPMNLVTLSRYMKLISIPNIVDLQPDSLKTQYDDLNIHQTYIFTSTAMHKETQTILEEVAQDFIGVVGFIIVDVEKMDDKLSQELGYGSKVKEVPAAAVKLLHSEELGYMEIKFTATNIRNFITDIIEAYSGEKKDESVEYNEEEEEGSEDDLFEVPPEEIQDDPVAEDAYLLRKKKINSPHIPALTDKTTPEFINEKSVGLIMFYVDWDARTQVFMEQYAMAGEALADKTKDETSPLARVNCADWPDVCEKNNVTRYPIFQLFKDTKLYGEYEGRLEMNSVVKFVSLHLLDNPIVLTTKEDVESFMTGKFSSVVPEGIETVVLGLFADDAEKEKKVFTDVGKQLHGQYLLGYSVDQIAKEIAPRFDTGVSSIIIIKLNDEHQPYVVLQQLLPTNDVIDFIKHSSLPIYTELRASNFVAYQSLQRPFLILFGNTVDLEGQPSQVIAEIAKSGQFSDLIFCWMNLEDDGSMGGYILHNYITEAPIPSIVMVNHQDGKVYSYPHPYDIDKSGIIKWLHMLKGGEIKMHTSELREGKWKPMMPGYDFLFFIDSEMGIIEEPPSSSGEEKQKEFRSGGIIRPRGSKSSNMNEAENEQSHSHTEL